ncbi:unnamed protein product [Rotaria sordida]|uniref:Uncharacterized protein n=1 Tax=Rotaria sordida TaxID=392033 RepID=A0A819RRL2_9BILA|nr:unnamed protein product [Rotaria sordida]CAF4050408.1 unnamed protein product [Rotaria sordida]
MPSKFTRLENLIFHGIKSFFLDAILMSLLILPCLSSLVIDCLDNVENKNVVFYQIFRLPVLKYCKLSLNEPFSLGSLPIATTEFSSIEHLVITKLLRLDELNGLLSYVPKLHLLSIHLSNRFSETYQQQHFIHLNHLTHVFLNITNMNFKEFELIIKNLFNRVEVLCITLKDDSTYLYENQWKQLILFHMHHLRIFDIMISYTADSSADIFISISLTNHFKSQFWFERRWFFEYQIYNDLLDGFIFYSINPYRRKSYSIYDERVMSTSSFRPKCNINPVQFVKIQEQEEIINCRYYFPNAIELTLSYFYEKKNQNFHLTSFNNIIPLKQLTKLVIHICPDRFVEIIELLLLSPNIHTFEIHCESLKYFDLILIENSETFQLLSKTNNIKEIIIMLDCTLEITKFFVNLCLRLQYLTMKISNDNLQLVLSFLFSKSNYITHNLFLLCIKYMSNTEFDILENFIVLQESFDVYLTRTKVNPYNNDVYLWW